MEREETDDSLELTHHLSRRKRVVFGLLIVGLTVMAVELAARAVCWSRFHRYETSIRIQGDSRWTSHPSAVWGNRPGYLEYDLSGQYNDHGMRVAPGQRRLPKKTAADFWVFLLGGSAMAGMGSNQNGDWLKITGVPSHPIADAIDGQLEGLLQRALPERRVRVLNAAVASYTAYQTRMSYRSLRALDPDWVIAMDGVNDARALADDEDSRANAIRSWDAHPIHHFPFREARFLMRNSAAFFLAGEYLFFKSNVIRNARNTRQDPAVMRAWLAREPTLQPPLASEGLERARRDFMEQLRTFDEELTSEHRKHLLLVQPHVSLRERAQVVGVERAVFNYYMSGSGGRPDAFMSRLYEPGSGRLDGEHIGYMEAVHGWDGWVFVDYCHFSKDANRRIAQALASHILTDGREKAF